MLIAGVSAAAHVRSSKLLKRPRRSPLPRNDARLRAKLPAIVELQDIAVTAVSIPLALHGFRRHREQKLTRTGNVDIAKVGSAGEILDREATLDLDGIELDAEQFRVDAVNPEGTVESRTSAQTPRIQ